MFRSDEKIRNNTEAFFAANDDKSPPLTRVLLYSKRSKTLSIYYYLCLLFFVLDTGSVVVQSCLDESSASRRRRVFGRRRFGDDLFEFSFPATTTGSRGELWSTITVKRSLFDGERLVVVRSTRSARSSSSSSSSSARLHWRAFDDGDGIVRVWNSSRGTVYASTKVRS